MNTAFAWGVNSKKIIEMKKFVQIVMSAANKKVIVEKKFKKAQNIKISIEKYRLSIKK